MRRSLVVAWMAAALLVALAGAPARAGGGRAGRGAAHQRRARGFDFGKALPDKTLAKDFGSATSATPTS